MWKKVAVTLLISLLLVPSFVNAEEKEAQEIRQIPVSQNYEYTSNVTDFRDTLSNYKSIFKQGIYAGPHLPPAKFMFSHAGDVVIEINLKLGFNVFVYGASDYYIYIPILNPEGDIAMHIRIDDFTFLDDNYFAYGGWSRDGMNYSVLAEHDLICYIPEYGYIIHNPFYPLDSQKTHKLEIAVHIFTSEPLQLLLSQEESSIIESTIIKIGSYFYRQDYSDLRGIESTVSDIPIAIAFLATQGLTEFGMGAVELPSSLGLYIPFLSSVGDKYVTLDMPYHFTKPSWVIIEYGWDAPTGYTEKKREAFVKNFLLQSTDTKLKEPATGEYSGAEFTIYPKSQQSYMIFVTTEEQNANAEIYDRITNDTWGSDYASYIVLNIGLTDNRYVALNSSNWKISKAEFAMMALENALLLQHYDLEHSRGPLANFIVPIANLAEASLLIQGGARQIDSRIVGFATFINELTNLDKFGKIVWQTLLKFWGYITKELNLFWEWIAPVLELALYFVFVIGVMFLMKYLSKLLSRRRSLEIS